MYRKYFGLLIVLTSVLFVCIAGCTGTDEPTVTSVTVTETPVYVVGIDGEYPPYSFIEKDGTIKGFDVDSIRWIADKMGFEVEIKPIAWDGIIPALQAGKIDMVYSGMTITEERKEKVNFSKPYLKINQSVAVYNDSGFTMDDFMSGDLVIGAQRGTTGAFWVEENLIETGKMSSDKLKTYDNFPLVAQDLLNKRLDAIIYDKPPLLDAISGKPLMVVGDIDTGEDYGVAIRKEDTELLDQINTGLDMLKSDPYWDELKGEYGL